MALKRPDLFYAYVGTGQIVDMSRNESLSYDMALKRARTNGNERATKDLERIGPPPYKDMRSWLVKQRTIVETAPSLADGLFLEENFYTAPFFTPSYSVRDSYDFFAAIYFSGTALMQELMSFNAEHMGARFVIPMFFFQGDSDVQTPTELLDEYFVSIDAPKKDLVSLKGCGHVAIFSCSDDFLKELAARVRPLAVDH